MYLSARNVTLAVWAALTASVIASPVHTGISEHETLGQAFKRAIEDENDVNRWCGLVDELSTVENAEEALSRTTLGGLINGHIRQNGTHEWLVNLQRHFYKNMKMEGTDARACGSLEATCSPGIKEDCRTAFEKSKGYFWRKEGWWILKAVKGVHTKLRVLRQKLMSVTLMTTLDIPQMAADFEASMDDDRFDATKMLEWMGVAVGAGDIAMGFAKDLNPMASAASGVLGMVVGIAKDNQPDEEKEPKVNIAKVQSDLSSFFNSTEVGISRTLLAAMGMAEDEADYKMLPSMNEDSYYESPIANFYDSAFWLLDDASPPIDEMLSAAVNTIRLYVVDMIIKGLGYGVLWDTRVEDSESCDGASRKWMHVAGKGRCFTLFQEDGDGSGEIPKDSSVPETMKKWGIHDLEMYYRSSIDCAKSKCKEPKKLGVGLVTDEGMPLCFFSAPVKKAEGVQDGCSGGPIGCYKRWGRLDFVINQDECPE